MQNGNTYGNTSSFRNIDWVTIFTYLILVIAGAVSIYAASYDFDHASMFDFSEFSGKQFLWIGLSLIIGFSILLIDRRLIEAYAYPIYGLMLLVLIVTIFVAPDIKGSRSWLVFGPVSLQPAEFAKFATALAVAKLMSTYGFDIHKPKHLATAMALILLPMLFIVGQRETGSALVYLSFFLMLYREGMPGGILFTGVAMVVYFVVGIKYEQVWLLNTPTSLGKFVVLLLVQMFTSAMVFVYCKEKERAIRVGLISLSITVVALLFSLYVIPFDVVWVQLIVCACLVGYLVYEGLSTQIVHYLLIALFSVGSIAFFYSADYLLNNVMEPHQRVRVNVLLGLDEDLAGAGYNVHQSEIAIGSGGLRGKGFLNGTQTKLRFVPEQDTDFIFCTVGEEEGFLGSAGVLLLFLALILRLIHLAERQPFKFGRVYGYCVLSVFLFHLFINVGMVLGLTPVIGIPLPFFSYGGSSLWGFTILLFIFLRIDAARNLVRS